MIIEQFLPAFHYGDAIGNSTLSFHRFLAEKGIESRIIALTIDECLKDRAAFFNDYKDNPTPESLKILHFAIPSELTDFFLNTKGKKAMIYHNITPSHFFVDFSDQLVYFTHEGRKHLERLPGCFDLSIADSTYNASELRTLNFKNVNVSPLMVNLEDYNAPYSEAYYNLFKDERKNIIFVGRITPNKKIEDLIKVLFFYKKYLSPSIRLMVAGNINTLPRYFYAVQNLAGRFYLSSEDIVFTGHIPFDELLAVYRLGDVFLSMSEHEGFCLPLIESSYFQIPVVAYDTGAVSETLGDAGILFKEKKYDVVAGLVEQVFYDEQLKTKLKKLQARRIEKYKKDSEPEKLLALLTDI
ncbi:MAG: glycosyltransferase [Candidatus Aminicenantes bacterium]|nr:glycosyltransferase [Candidatus Aminicenantes bacterium]NIM84135.1 glycosyltransferase [Candidatus Aminicenantes bacterium]NIN23583.1 glycosyltransferase [Candidatus Aminicenantes bacterium]NIN47290.1 glycosyltransferase [Candidatus Aminicenantes bacterium]NIN90219.1 glycosyltransferase [Candidatus Aminicenantes bacterium]